MRGDAMRALIFILVLPYVLVVGAISWAMYLVCLLEVWVRTGENPFARIKPDRDREG